MIMKLKKIAAAFLSAGMLFSGLTGFSASAADTVLADPDLNGYITEYMEKSHTSGLSLVAVEGENVSYLNHGYDNIAQQIPATEHTHYELASVSKAFTGLSIMLLQEEGKLSVDDSISKYLPWFDVKWQGQSYDVKIWQLLNHTSGIPETKTYRLANFKRGTDEKLKEETARIAEGLDLSFEPGTKYEYCNLNYDILAYLAEIAAGERFEDYMERKVFTPIGMTETGYDIPTAQGYQRDYGHTFEYDAPRFKGCQGDGYVITTTADMSLWIKAQLGQLELPEKLANAIERSHHADSEERYIKCDERNDGTPLYYMNGWELTKDAGLLIHSGGNPNFSTMLYIDRERNVGTFAASNMSSMAPLAAADSAYQLMTGDGFERRAADTSQETVPNVVTAGALILLAVIIISMLTQKKRLAKKPVNMKKEKIKLCVRLILLTLLLALFIAAPYIIGFNYTMVVIWLPLSFLISFLLIDLDLILLIVTSIKRFSSQKKIAD